MIKACKIWSLLIGFALFQTTAVAMHCFRGWADDVYPVEICLDTLDGEVSGALKFVDAGLEFELEGIGMGDTLRLIEFDTDGNISGYVYLGRVDSRWQGRWMNAEKNLESSLLLLDPDKDYISTKCGGNKWMKAFRFSLDGGMAKGLVVRSAQQLAYGYIYFPEGGRERVMGKCLNRNCDRISLYLTDNPDVRIEVDFLVGREVEVRQNRAGLLGKGAVDKIWTMDCYGLITYTSSFDLLYPELDPAFEQRILEYLGKWSREVKFREKTEYGAGELQPEYRWINRFYGWLEVDAANDRFISGLIELIGPRGGVDGFSFNYDLLENRFVSITENLRKKETIEEIVEEILEKSEGRRPTWEYVTLRREGVVLRTSFDPIYGRREFVIPFDKYDRFFKQDLIDYVNE